MINYVEEPTACTEWGDEVNGSLRMDSLSLVINKSTAQNIIIIIIIIYFWSMPSNMSNVGHSQSGMGSPPCSGPYSHLLGCGNPIVPGA